MPFVTFEGIEGSGKSTLVRLLAERLGEGALPTREPGGTAVGRAVRGVLLDPGSRGLTPTTELLLYFADRAQHVEEVVRPALEAGRIVLCDRYVESSLAYQGYGRGLPLATIRALAELATGGLRPDAIVYLDVPVEVGLGRVARRGAHDRLEAEVLAFHQRVKTGYEELISAEPSRWLRVDATPGPEAVVDRVELALEQRGLRARATR